MRPVISKAQRIKSTYIGVPVLYNDDINTYAATLLRRCLAGTEPLHVLVEVQAPCLATMRIWVAITLQRRILQSNFSPAHSTVYKWFKLHNRGRTARSIFKATELTLQRYAKNYMRSLYPRTRYQKVKSATRTAPSQPFTVRIKLGTSRIAFIPVFEF